MAFRNSTIRINKTRMKQLEKAAVVALVDTVKALHTEVVQAEVIPRDTGTMQGEGGTFVDMSRAEQGTVSLVTTAPQARRLYYHPEYNFHREDWVDSDGKKHGSNPNAKGKWLEPWKEGGEHENFCRDTFATLFRKGAGL